MCQLYIIFRDLIILLVFRAFSRIIFHVYSFLSSTALIFNYTFLRPPVRSEIYLPHFFEALTVYFWYNLLLRMEGRICRQNSMLYFWKIWRQLFSDFATVTVSNRPEEKIRLNRGRELLLKPFLSSLIKLKNLKPGAQTGKTWEII